MCQASQSKGRGIDDESNSWTSFLVWSRLAPIQPEPEKSVITTSPLEEEVSMRGPRLFTILLGIMLSLSFVESGKAQIAQAEIHGTVMDESGAVLPGVTVTATQVETGSTRTVVTTERGG